MNQIEKVCISILSYTDQYQQHFGGHWSNIILFKIPIPNTVSYTKQGSTNNYNDNDKHHRGIMKLENHFLYYFSSQL